MSEQPDPLDMIASNTIAVMTGAPEHKETWFKNVQDVRAQAQAAGDAPMATLLDAVLKLLIGNQPDTVHPNLTGEHAACWQTITQALRQWQQIQDARHHHPN